MSTGYPAIPKVGKLYKHKPTTPHNVGFRYINTVFENSQGDAVLVLQAKLMPTYANMCVVTLLTHMGLVLESNFGASTPHSEKPGDVGWHQWWEEVE
jgi:hypothetical protein